jgi:hypothetical protein
MSRILALSLVLFLTSGAAADELRAVPPEQIGRLAAISGPVSFRAGADAAASEVAMNYPLTTGDRLATPPRTYATIDIAAGRFYLDGGSALTIGALGPGTTAVRLQQGALILHILPGGAGQVFVVETPRGALRADQPGYFEVEIPGPGTVIASSLEGGAQFDETTVLPPGTRATIAADHAPLLEAVVEDDFIRRVAAEVEASGENKLEAGSISSPGVRPGSTMPPGASRPRITAAGSRSMIAGPGSPTTPFSLPPWRASSEPRTSTATAPPPGCRSGPKNRISQGLR